MVGRKTTDAGTGTFFPHGHREGTGPDSENKFLRAGSPPDQLRRPPSPAPAGKHSAILYTIVASARRRGLDPEAYLTDIIRRLPTTPATQMHTLTPAAWAAEQKRERPAPPSPAVVTPAPAKPAPARTPAA